MDDLSLSLNERLVLRAIPTMPEITTARRLTETMPYLSRSTIDKALRSLRSRVLVMDGSRDRAYAKFREGSLL